MADSILDGDIAIIKKQDVFEDGKISVVIVNGDEGTLKKVKITDTGIILQPLNPKYEMLVYSKKEIETIPVLMAGKLVDLKRHYD